MNRSSQAATGKRFAPISIAFLSLLIGVIFIPLAGIESDESVFALPFYEPFNRDFGITVFHHHLPLMIFYYAGTLKTLLYWPVLHLFGPNAWSIRLPVAMMGAFTVALFFVWSSRIACTRVALLGALLLCTDPSFVLTNTFDWGPVALEHLLLMAGCVLFVLGRPAFGCFLFGAALWNKTIFSWALSGLIVGAMAVYWPSLRLAVSRPRMVARCLMAFLLGAMPLIVYNLHRPNATLHANVHLSTEGIETKLVSLRYTLDGSILFGTIAATDSAGGAPKVPGSLPSWIGREFGERHQTLFLYGMLFAVAATPLWWRSAGRRAGLFALVSSTAAFTSMALIRYTGAAHHIVLLYPMPQLLVAVAIASIRPRWLCTVAGATLIVANLLVLNQYALELERNGAFGLFTNAFYPLSGALSDSSGDLVYPIDYGIGENLTVMHQGRLRLQFLWILSMQPGEIEAVLARERALFIGHVPSREYYVGAAARLDAIARSRGYEKRVERVVADSNGRPQFQIFRYSPPEGAGGESLPSKNTSWAMGLSPEISFSDSRAALCPPWLGCTRRFEPIRRIRSVFHRGPFLRRGCCAFQ